MPTLFAEMLKDVELGSVVTPASCTLFMINKSSLPLDETHRKRFHDDAKGHSGAIARVGNASMYASPTKHKVMSRSSFEAGDHTSSDGKLETHGGTRIPRRCYQSVAG